ncbi:hypothetical protein [Mycolicibacterium sp. S3B2]|uniref:hypothetical protein n=1 Tax=Mycolicibacterium sp. S3B2 TaxID=3415120 RepID=UPI003C7A1561
MTNPIPTLTPLRPSRRTEADLLEAWAALLAAAADLPGAACRGRGEEFDADLDGEDRDAREQRLGRAVATCRQCPALADCSTWLDSQPRRRWPTGVVAGRVVEATPGGKPRLRRPRTAQDAAAPSIAGDDSPTRPIALQGRPQRLEHRARCAS